MRDRIDIQSVFKNKKIALVGNAESMLAMDCGREIDQHDLVCRINLGPSLQGRVSHGDRLDVLFFSEPTWIPQNSKIPESVLRIHTSHRDNPTFMSDADASAFVPAIPTDYFFPKHNWEELRKQIGYTHKEHWHSTGVTAIYILLRAGPCCLSLYGFDFKNSYTFYHENKILDPVDARRADTRHRWELEELYVKKLISEHPCISLK